MDKLIIGSHVSFTKEEGLLGSLKEALSYNENTFMFYTGAPQNTIRGKIDEEKTKEAKKLMEENNIDISDIIIHAPYIVNLANNKDEDKFNFAVNFLKQELKNKYDCPYPKELKYNIINRNMKLLHGNLPSYDKQIIKASERGDYNSINHRVCEFMASYFDIIFALNEQTHPGEKRLVSIALKQCKVLPINFEENINKLFNSMFHNPEVLSKTLSDMIFELSKVI